MAPYGIVLEKVEGKPGQVYYPLKKVDLPEPKPGLNDVVIRMEAASLNHRDLFCRQNLYPRVAFGVPIMADGCGTVVATGSAASHWQGKRVIPTPGTGWDSDPSGPESPQGYRILGGTSSLPAGTAVTHLVYPASDLEEAPAHLSSAEASALSLAGLTAYRATLTKARDAMRPGANVLITGIGGGVALMALLFAVHAGANVYVTSGSDDKIQKAKQLGAKGGVSYKEKGWEKSLLKLSGGKKFDAIIDGAGSDVVDKAVRVLKDGGIVSQYGMTVSPKMGWNMGAVLKNIELKGSTMGSRKEFRDMVAFVRDKGLRPVVSQVIKGLDNLEGLEGLFEEMKGGRQFGKLVVEIAPEEKGKSKL